MEDLISQCEWPPLPARYDEALRECVRFLLDRYDVTAILACGTIVRGNPDPSSDLDVNVIHRADYMQRVQRVFSGVPTEMFVNPLPQVYRHMDRGQTERRPQTANMIAHGFAVLDILDQVESLRARAVKLLAQEPTLSDEALTAERYRTALLYEDALDAAPRDKETAAMILGEAVERMLSFRFARARMYLPRKKDLLEILAAFDQETADFARRFYVAGDLPTRLELAGLIADRTIQARGFFEWESTPIITEP
jgi:hypothetical protein